MLNKKIPPLLFVILLISGGIYLYQNKLSKNGTNVDVVPGSDLKSYTLSDISVNNTKESCWTAIDGNVYNITDFISKHKGGDKILAVCGIDGSDLFSGKDPMGRAHGDLAKMMLSNMKIGTLQN